MSNKPTAITGLMKEKLAFPKYPGITTSNRFLLLGRNGAGGGQGRDRSLSYKRSRIESEGDKEEVSENGEADCFASMEKTEAQMKEARAIIGQVRQEVAKLAGDKGPLQEIMSGMVKWMEVMTTIQEDTTSIMLDGFERTERKVKAAAKGGSAAAATAGDHGNGHVRGKGKEGDEEADPRRKKFAQAVRDAEKATLVFNTDMGNVPVMNTATMNRKFSLALKAMAAVQDGNANGEPKADTVTQLDDTLSMVKNMEYFGKTTKKSVKGDFFTIPVKLSYKDKDTRMTAEVNLRKMCKVSCTTPYHSSLRDVIKKAVDDCKTRYKDCFIQPRVDVDSMCLKISYRKYGEKGAWHNDVEVIGLPESVLDLSNKVSRVNTGHTSMETDGGEQSQG